MATFTRKNALLCTMSLTAADGSGTQPNTATLHLAFQDLNGQAQTSTISLTFDPVAKTWGGVWDSSLAGELVEVAVKNKLTLGVPKEEWPKVLM